MSEPGADLRAEVEAQTLVQVERIGPDGFDKAGLVNSFMGRGASRATLYRWVDAVLKSGKAGQHLAKVVKKAAEKKRQPKPRKATESAREAATKLPAIVRPADLAGTGTIPIIEYIQRCLRTAEDVMAYARTEEGKVRNAKLLVSASEHLRRSLETSVRLYEAMRSVNQVDAFHAAIIEEIGRESPELAERVLRRLSALSTQWTP